MRRLRFGLQGKFAISLVVMLLAIVVAVTAIIAVQYRSRMEQLYSDAAFSMATYASKIIDGDRARTYVRTGVKDEYYERIRELLLRAKQAMGLRYFYVVVPEADKQLYIWDSGEPGEEGICDLLTREDYFSERVNVIMHAAFAKDAPHAIVVTRSEQYGYIASAYVAILDKAGVPAALASVDVSMDEIDAQINGMILISAGIAVGVLLLCLAGYWWCIRRIVIEPLDKLAGAARNFTSERARGEGLVMEKVRISSRDEIGELYRAMSKMEVDMTNYLENLRKVTAERERVGAELNVAKQIQADMLPSIFPAFPDRHDFDIYATMTPAKEVGGDFYDFFFVDETHLAMVIADVSGKGVPAALFMVIAKTLIKNRTLASGTPAQILADVNNQLCEGNVAQLFVTVWLGILDLTTGKGVAANAGHEHPALRRRGGRFELVKYAHDPMLGLFPDLSYSDRIFRLSPGDTLLVYTDGVPEAKDAGGRVYGKDRMTDALNRTGDGAVAGLLNALRTDARTFVGNAPQFDDITLLAVTFLGATS